MYDYQFPAITLKTTDSEQVKKLHDEVMEFTCSARIFGCNGEEDEKLDPLNVNACIELWDVIHACETLMRRFDQDIVRSCAHIVAAKNRARGYYDAPCHSEGDARVVTVDDFVNGRC